MALLLFLACAPDYSNGDATAGAAIYEQWCTSCHGADGTLGVEMNGKPAADLTVVTGQRTDDELADAILNGKREMPAQPLKNSETADCIAYLRATFPAQTDSGGDSGP